MKLNTNLLFLLSSLFLLVILSFVYEKKMKLDTLIIIALIFPLFFFILEEKENGKYLISLKEI